MRSTFLGGLWPVVQRELRETARRPANHWLRWAAAGLAMAALLGLDAAAPMEDTGVLMFTKLDAVLTVIILFLLPAMTADCIASERRDGTLGLLFMTPLTATEIVLGKVVSRVLRVFAIWLGALPILAVCFICGGIEPVDLLKLMMIHVACGMVSLSAGLLATSLTRSRMAAYVLAFVLLGIFLLPIRSILDSFDAFSPSGWSRYGITSGAYTLSIQSARAAGLLVGYAANHVAFSILAEKILLTLLMCWASARIAGAAIRRSWQDKPPSKRTLGLIKRYCTPLKQFSYSKRMRQTLESNPISWLQQCSWKARTTKWSLCLFFVLVETAAIEGKDLNRFSAILAPCVLLLFGAYALAGINGFHYDKSSGALELILVTPLSPTQIVFGRIRGLWKLFLPSTAVLVGSIIFLDFDVHKIWYGSDLMPEIAESPLVLFSVEIVIVYLTLPLVATSTALRFKQIAWSAVATTVLAFGPMLLLYSHEFTDEDHVYHYWKVSDVHPSIWWYLTTPVLVFSAQLLVTWLVCKRMHRSLNERRFAFQ